MGMDPFSMAVMGVTTGVKLFGAHQANQAQEQAAAYNNQLAQAEALNHMKENHQAHIRQNEKNQAELGAMKARLAGSGFQSDTDTELNLVTESAGRMQLAIEDQSRSAQMRANSMRAQGKMGLWEAKSRSRANTLGMFNTVADGIAGGMNMTRMRKFYGVS